MESLVLVAGNDRMVEHMMTEVLVDGNLQKDIIIKNGWVLVHFPRRV